ncbi:MAG: hypothetical protein IKQ94_05195, partial [Bacteroidales bacterium]|nr:hypothetical protein [Bacteroidales bacterium]
WGRRRETMRKKTQAAGAVWGRRRETMRKKTQAAGAVWGRRRETMRKKTQAAGAVWGRTSGAQCGKNKKNTYLCKTKHNSENDEKNAC